MKRNSRTEKCTAHISRSKCGARVSGANIEHVMVLSSKNSGSFSNGLRTSSIRTPKELSVRVLHFLATKPTTSSREHAPELNRSGTYLHQKSLQSYCFFLIYANLFKEKCAYRAFFCNFSQQKTAFPHRNTLFRVLFFTKKGKISHSLAAN